MAHQEKQPTTPEHRHNAEALAEAANEARERLGERLNERAERSPAEDDPERARHEALEKAASAEKESRVQEEQPSAAERRHHRPSRIEQDASFNTTMQEVRGQMSPTDRVFSKVIHNKTVEKVSDGVGSTIARPNAILTGSLFAFILTLGVYVLAKNLGYTLSGFEAIGAFVLGWILGITYDFLKIMITGRTS